MTIWVTVDWDAFSQEDYLEHKKKTDDQYYHFYDLWRTLRQNNAPDAMASVSKLRHLVDLYGADAADGAVNMLLGSETATDLISDYENKQDWEDDEYWYEVNIAENIDYMANNYGPVDCRKETENLLGQVWAAERGYPQMKGAVDEFCRMFFGVDFAELFAMA